MITEKISTLLQYIYVKDSEIVLYKYDSLDINIWQLIRFDISNAVQENIFGSAGVSKSSTLETIIQFSKNTFAKKNIEKNIFLCSQSKGNSLSTYIDEEVDLISEKTNSYLDWFYVLAILRISRKLRKNDFLLTYCNEINKEVFDKFNVEINIYGQLIRRLSEFIYLEKYMIKLCEKHNIDTIYCAPFTHREYLSEVAKKSNVKIIEIQHGIIDINHLSYSYGEINASKLYLPNQIYLWSDYFKGNIDSRINSKTISISNPNIQRYNFYDCVVISQYTITNQMINFVNKLAKNNPESKIAFKLHPAEILPKEAIFLDNVEIIENNIECDYIINMSSIIIGAYSTVMYEAICSKANVFIIRDLCIINCYLEDDRFKKIQSTDEISLKQLGVKC